MKRKTINNWKIVPTTGNTVSLIGEVDGQVIQTSPIAQAKPGEVRTQNTHYVLGEKMPGVWEIQLDMRRPSQSENLRKNGVL
uniref:Uncharacterized protein n=1 Tax=Pseudomonas fluorescens (strain SBW25) TaxID=216595 RepID=A0A0G4E5I2_PSEFS|nr:hypothetical protein [Pseudomonas fluorescens]CEK42237.1 hypothetical protein PQBR57_0284 [Pseudomonas fluorescens SBW25]